MKKHVYLLFVNGVFLACFGSMFSVYQHVFNQLSKQGKALFVSYSQFTRIVGNSKKLDFTCDLGLTYLVVKAPIVKKLSY